MIAQSLTAFASRPRRLDAAVTATMADFLLRHSAGDGGVTREELLLDFSDEQIDTHLEAAKQLARKRGKGRA